MKIEEAINTLNDIATRQSSRDQRLAITVLRPGSVGGTPCVTVIGMYAGIDWNAGKILLETDVPLTTLTPEDVAAIHKSAKEGQSWHAYQSHKKQAAKIEALESELAALKAGKLDPQAQAL